MTKWSSGVIMISSKGLPDGVTSGISRTHVCRSQRTISENTSVYLTEGPLKAEVILWLLCQEGLNDDVAVIAVQGVNNINELPMIAGKLKKEGVRRIQSAFDMDKCCNPAVATASRKIKQIFNAEQIAVDVLCWDQEYALRKREDLSHLAGLNIISFQLSDNPFFDIARLSQQLSKAKIEYDTRYENGIRIKEHWRKETKGLDDYLNYICKLGRCLKIAQSAIERQRLLIWWASVEKRKRARAESRRNVENTPGVPQGCGAPGCFSVFNCGKKLQSGREALRNHETRSQAAGLDFMVQLEHVVGEAQKCPLDLYLDRAAEHKPSKVHVFLCHGEDALGLNTAVHADQLPFIGVDPLLHFLPLSDKALGNIDHLVSFLQRLLAPTGTDALLFQRTAGTVLATVYGGLCLEAALRFAFLGEVICDQLPFCTGVGVLLSVIRHILTAADVCTVFLRFLLLMVAGLHI